MGLEAAVWENRVQDCPRYHAKGPGRKCEFIRVSLNGNVGVDALPHLPFPSSPDWSLTRMYIVALRFCLSVSCKRAE